MRIIRSGIIPYFRIAIVPILALVASCAKPFSPPGGVQDRTPPRLVSTTPAALAVVPQFNDKIVFQFDETLSERGVNDAVVSVSPQPRGKVHVARKGDRIEVGADGGWARNQVYRVIVRPGVADRFNNGRKDPVEIVFSTGPPIQNTAIAGLITDRITGRITNDAAVEAVRRGDSATYMAASDTAGFFAMRFVPAGVYDVRAFGDANRNHRKDPSESSSAVRQITLGATDTIVTELVLLPSDSTPPALKRADPLDSMHVVLTFDDFIDPEFGLTGRGISFTTADGQPVGGILITQLRNVWQRAAQQAAATAPPPSARPDTTTRRPPRTRADSLRADSTARADSSRLAILRDAGAGRPGGDRGRPRAAADTTPLPDRDVILTINTVLPPGKYRVTMSGVKNVNGLTGGGAVDLEIKPPPVKPPVGKSQAPGGNPPAR